MIKGILTSIGITFLVSSGVAYFLTSFNIPFVKSFLFTTAIQFILFYFYNEYKRTRINKFAVEKLSETELQFEQSGADVVCANCKKEVFAPIELPEPSNFTCPHCGSENSIYLNIETAVVTRPV